MQKRLCLLGCERLLREILVVKKSLNRAKPYGEMLLKTAMVLNSCGLFLLGVGTGWRRLSDFFRQGNKNKGLVAF